MKQILLLAILFVVTFGEINAQFYGTQYRTPGQDWRQLQTERFRVIYPARYDSLARQSLTILEMEYGTIQNLIGGELRDFPVILNPDNDRSNGFVAPFNFRSEVEIAPFLGKSLSPRSGSWFETVLPHELVHAIHFGYNPPSIVRPIGLFSPDARRSIHAAAAFGFIEGIAVEHESHGIMDGAGRGNYAYFNNQFEAVRGSGDPWSLSQLVQTTAFTPPFNRHYIGGYQFVNWLQDEYGYDTMETAIRQHYQLPFFGFGFALRRTTGDWPRGLYRDFMEGQESVMAQHIEQLAVDTDSASEELPYSATCRRGSRPLWMNNSDLVFYARSCNRPWGFYTYDGSSGSAELIHEVSITSDHHYSLSDDKSRLLYSRFHADPLYDNSFLADIHELDLDTGSDRRITREQRVVSPAYWAGDILAAQTAGQTLELVVIDPANGEVASRFHNADHSTIITVAVAPKADRETPVAILGKRHGVQAIWFEDLTSTQTLMDREPDIVMEDASLFDPSWSPGGDQLYFAADRAGTMNLYRYDVESGTIYQITESRYLAMEGALSPDGDRLAYIYQVDNDQLPVILESDDFYNEPLSDAAWGVTANVTSALNRPLLNEPDIDDSVAPSGWESSDYSTGFGWLKPRLWLPVADEIIDNPDEFGISVESADRLGINAYSLELTYFRSGIWFDGIYRYKGRYPGFELNMFNQPGITTFQFENQNEERVFLPTIAQQRGATLSVPFRYRIEQNTRFSSFVVEPEFSARQLRFTDFNDATRLYSEYEKPLYTIGLNTTMNLGLRQYTRDVQPNRGIQFFTQARYGLNSSEFSLRLPGGVSTNPIRKRSGFRAGAVWYVAPLSRYNQSLRVGLQGFTQTSGLVFNTESVLSNLFEAGATRGATEFGVLDTRYTIPLIYPDDGGMLLPVYLSNIYMVLFSQTVADLDRWESSARTVVGAGLRSRFRIGNIQLDLGIAIGWEPSRSRVDYLFGSF